MLKDGESSDSRNGEGKTAVKNDRNPQPQRGPIYDKYIELNALLSDIYLDTNGAISYP